MKVFQIILIVIYSLSAAVQYNDPDPYIWIPIYLLPVAMIYLNIKAKISRDTFLWTAFIYFLWAVNQFPPAWEGLMFNTMGMKTLNIELARESLGLGMVGTGLIALFLVKK
ncbi:MAG: transmembrane 220 family protein [Leadbetterella sp.]